MSIKIGLIGFGNVGQGTLSILQKNSRRIQKRLGSGIEIKTIAVRDPEKYAGIDIGSAKLTTRIQDILEDPEIQIVVEAIGGEYPAFDYISEALSRRKFVVTANKEVVAKHLEHFLTLAKTHNVDILFEAAVCAGIPILQALKTGFSANKIEAVYGILNGTTNYILTKIEEDQKSFSSVLKEAQKLGLAEADPSMDLSGKDAAYKLAILCAVAFGKSIPLENLACEGIEKITLSDIQSAKELGYKIKLLGIGEQIGGQFNIKVRPMMLPKNHPLASIRNEFNAVLVKGNAVGDAMLVGKGAGPLPTGSAILSDIIDVILNHFHPKATALWTELEPAELIPTDKLSAEFYTRLISEDHPGVFEQIAGIFSRADISLKKVIQKDSPHHHAEIVIITHKVKESQMEHALRELAQLPSIETIGPTIRVENKAN